MSGATEAAIAWIDAAGATAWGAAGLCGPAAGQAGAPATATGPPPPTGAARAAALPPGQWGTPQELALPLADRGLQLADGLFETLWLEAGRPQLLEAHLSRWRDSAELLGMDPPPSGAQLQPLLAAAVERSGIQRGVLRLNWSRGAGGGGRGIDLPGPGDPCAPHRFWFQLRAGEACFTPVTVLISQQERRNAASRLSRCKTFAYGAAVQARREARAAGADDALLLAGDGRLSCASCANLLLRLGGQWLTPDLASGCLPGVMRGRAIARGLAREAPLWPEDLEGAEAILLINSLGCRPIRRWRERNWPSSNEAERLWRGLLAGAS